VPTPPLILDDDLPELREGLAQIRDELDVPGPHGDAASAEAEVAAQHVSGTLGTTAGAERTDARDVPFVTIDPPGSRDLDQALHLERRPGGGFRVRYAIADVAAFVAPGSVLDGEVWERGVTYYLPDARAPLHPPVLGEGAASLLPEQDRPALLWTIDLDRDGVSGDVHLARALVRSRAQLTYAGVQASIDGGRAEGTVALLAEVGARRLDIEIDRGGVSLDLPTQRIVLGQGGYRLELEAVVPAMGWNAQISLLTGMVAARTMLDAGVGLLRTLPPPPKEVVRTVRLAATALGVPWRADADYAAAIRALDGDEPADAALLALAARGLRGAGYLALVPDGAEPPRGSAVEHAAVAAPYAHVTAPLRRLADRYALEVSLAILGGTDPAPELVGALDELPKAMARATGREGNVSRACIDLVEALLLRPRVGEVLDATVVSVGEDRSTVVIPSLAVQAEVAGAALPLGDPVRVRVEEADPVARQVRLGVA
jgi:exoribonuclease R